MVNSTRTAVRPHGSVHYYVLLFTLLNCYFYRNAVVTYTMYTPPYCYFQFETLFIFVNIFISIIECHNTHKQETAHFRYICVIDCIILFVINDTMPHIGTISHSFQLSLFLYLFILCVRRYFEREDVSTLYNSIWFQKRMLCCDCGG